MIISTDKHIKSIVRNLTKFQSFFELIFVTHNLPLANEARRALAQIGAVSARAVATVQAGPVVAEVDGTLAAEAREAILAQAVGLVVVVVLVAEAAILAGEVGAQAALFAAVGSLEVGVAGACEGGGRVLDTAAAVQAVRVEARVEVGAAVVAREAGRTGARVAAGAGVAGAEAAVQAGLRVAGVG